MTQPLDRWGIPDTEEMRQLRERRDAAAQELVTLCLISPDPRSRKGRRIFELAREVVELSRQYFSQSKDPIARTMLEFVESSYGARIQMARERGWLDGPPLEDRN